MTAVATTISMPVLDAPSGPVSSPHREAPSSSTAHRFEHELDRALQRDDTSRHAHDGEDADTELGDGTAMPSADGHPAAGDHDEELALAAVLPAAGVVVAVPEHAPGGDAAVSFELPGAGQHGDETPAPQAVVQVAESGAIPGDGAAELPSVTSEGEPPSHLADPTTGEGAVPGTTTAGDTAGRPAPADPAAPAATSRVSGARPEEQQGVVGAEDPAATPMPTPTASAEDTPDAGSVTDADADAAERIAEPLARQGAGPAPATSAASGAAATTPTAQTAPADAPVDTPNPPTAPTDQVLRAEELAEGLRAAFRRGLTSKSLSLQLHPAELGAVQVEARLVDGVTHLVLRTESPVAIERISATLDQLRHDLSSQGLDVGDLELRHGNQERGRGNDSDRADRTAEATSGSAHARTTAPVGGHTQPGRGGTHPGSIALDL